MELGCLAFIFGGLFYKWTTQQLELHLGVTEADVIARLSQYSFALMGAVLLIWGLYRFLTREADDERSLWSAASALF